MVFIVRLLKASVLKNKHERYIELKKQTLKDQQKKLGIFKKFKFWWYRTCPLLCGGKRQPNEPFSRFERFQISIKTAGTYENYIAKSFLGFISGVVLTFIFFMFFVFQLKFSLIVATCMASVIGIILTLGLAFSTRVRCVVLMMMPQFFSKRGRQAIVAYAYILALTGPAKNMLYNMRVLSETMACNQEKLKQAVKSIVDLIKEPFRALRDTMKQISEKVKVVVNKVKAMIEAIKKTIKSLIGVIKSAYDWLNSVVGMCSKKVGTPFERCMKSFEGAIVDCKDKLGPLLDWMCSVAYVASHLCYAVKPFDFVCDLIDFVSDEIVNQVKHKFQEFTQKVKTIFYVKIEFSHAFGFSTEQSKSIKDVSAGIMQEVKQKTAKLSFFFDWMSLMLSFFFLFMVCKVLNYKRKFMNNDAYDNHFITENIIRLDINRTKQRLETILPLNIYEKRKYVQMSSMRLVKSERAVIAKSAVFLALYTIKLIIHILLDYSLWWILNMIRIHGKYETHLDAPGTINAHVDGKGMLPELYASVFNAFQPSTANIDSDIAPCLPEPMPPNIARYKEIGVLVVIAWILSFAEPYGLRLRFAVMSYYYPERAKVRAVWLYNNILRSRGSFLKYARRQLRRKFGKSDEGIEEVSIIDRLRAKFPLLRKIWKGKQLTACLLCGSLGSKDSPLVKCPRPECVGIFCVHCYATLENLCTICRLPIEYGDLSDISEEKDSSDDQSKMPHLEEKLEEASDTTEELNLTDALLSDEGDSDLSYGYQYKERDVRETTDVPLRHKDVEVQKPKDRVSIYDFGDKVPQVNLRSSMTLAERKRSGLWGLIPDDAKDFPTWTEERQSKKLNLNEKLLKKRTLSAAQTEFLLNESDIPSESSEDTTALSNPKKSFKRGSNSYMKGQTRHTLSKEHPSHITSKDEIEDRHVFISNNFYNAAFRSKGLQRISEESGDRENHIRSEDLSEKIKPIISDEFEDEEQEEEEAEELDEEEQGNVSEKYEPGDDLSDEVCSNEVSECLVKEKSVYFEKPRGKRISHKDKINTEVHESFPSYSLKNKQNSDKLPVSKPKSILKTSARFTDDKIISSRQAQSDRNRKEELISESKSVKTGECDRPTSNRFFKENSNNLSQKRSSAKISSFSKHSNFGKKPRLDGDEKSFGYYIQKSNGGVQETSVLLDENLHQTSHYQCTIFPELTSILKSSTREWRNESHSLVHPLKREDGVDKGNGKTGYNDVLLKPFETLQFNSRSTCLTLGAYTTDNKASRYRSYEPKREINNMQAAVHTYFSHEQEPTVRFIQSPRSEASNKVTRLRNNNIHFDGGKIKPQSVQRWLESGVYHSSVYDNQTTENRSLQPLLSIQTSFQQVFEILNISKCFRKWKCFKSKKSDEVKLTRLKQIRRLGQINTLRERSKQKFKKQVKIKNSFWDKFNFWRKEDELSFSSTYQSTTSSESMSLHEIVEPKPKKKRTILKKSLKVSTLKQTKYDELNTENSSS